MSSAPDEALAAHELDLVTRAAKGDAAAFDRFYERNASAVQLLVERLLGPGEAADQVVVEAFEKTVRRLPLLGARNSSPALYVLSTARNGAYAALGGGRPSAPDGPVAALLALPSRQRELLALREIGLPEAQCAEVAGIDASDVGPQVARARLRLTDELEGQTLSAVFADARAERLLAAEVVRVEGQALDEQVASQISEQADADARFAAALSAVRSPSRSIGQLPPVSGAARLAASARGRAVVPGPGSPPPATAAAMPPTSVTPEAPDIGRAPADADGDVSASPPPTTSDPYDATIGDEAAWGIVDDDGDGFEAPPVAPEAPSIGQPTDGQWSDGAGHVSDDAPTELRPASAASEGAIGGTAPDPGAAASLHDPFAGWDDELGEWDDEQGWAAGPGAAASGGREGSSVGRITPMGQPAGSASAASGNAGGESSGGERTVVDLGETRAFDAVAAGLVDPGLPGDEPRKRGSIWRWLIWLLALVLLAVGAGVAAYAYKNAKQDPEPPASRIDAVSPTATPRATPRRSSSSSSSSRTPKSTPRRSPAAGASTGGGSRSGSRSGGTSNATTTSGRTSSGTSNGSTSKPSSTGGATKPTNNDQVTSGDADSGGAVRGGGEAGGGTSP